MLNQKKSSSPGAQGIFFLAAFLCSQLLWSATTPWKVNPNGQVRLISASNSLPRHGKVTLGLHFKTAPGWYVYWKVAGDAGYPPKVTWDGSRGLSDFHMLWPAPTKFILPGDITEYGYEGEVVYPIQATVSSREASAHIAAKVSYLTCNTSCVPYKYDFTLDLPVGEAVPDPEAKDLIDRYTAQVPPASKTEEQIQHSAPTLTKRPEAENSATSSPSLPLATLLFFAFIGGVILNVMPCVLPVLSIKLLGLVKQSGHAHHLIARNSLLSAAGIITSFLGLGAIAVIAKEGGRAVGWGIQFQNPIFVLFLIAILVLFSLNLWGVFEIGMPRIFGHFATTYGQHETPMAHFMSGLFATLLATPCSAPFLGSAMGFALTQSPGTIMAAFLTAGCGMALPYFILMAVPGSLHWLPKPGPWMVRLKAFFGVLLAGTAVWLLWVFMRQVRPIPHEAFDETKIQSIVAEGHPVLVDVTADWCVTCKYNERFVLDSSEVKEALARRDVIIMRADWTNRDETIRQYLVKFGRSGIPFYAFYEPGKDPVTLSEFLTKKRVLDVLSK